MARLGVGAIAPDAGLAALSALLSAFGLCAKAPRSQVVACVLFWDRCAIPLPQWQ